MAAPGRFRQINSVCEESGCPPIATEFLRCTTDTRGQEEMFCDTSERLPHDLLDARRLLRFKKTPRQNDCCSENIQVVASHHRAFIQLPDFIQQHVFRVWNCNAAAGVGPVIKHQQSGVRSSCKLRQLFR